MRELHKAMAVVIACCLAMAGIFVAAYLKRRPALASQELLSAVGVAVDEAIDAALASGGLRDAEGFIESRTKSIIKSSFDLDAGVRIQRRNDFDPLSAFYFDVVAGELNVRFRLDGVKDPLLAMRLGLDWVWREEPNHPYGLHGGSAVMSDCLTNHYFHAVIDAPDFFARLENKTDDPYHYGVETFIVSGGSVAVDHLLLGRGVAMDATHRDLYGLK